jgi:hypothetical protein
MWDTRKIRICDTVTWLPTQVKMPLSSSTDRILAGISDITEALLNPSPASLISPLADSQVALLKDVMVVLQGACSKDKAIATTETSEPSLLLAQPPPGAPPRVVTDATPQQTNAEPPRVVTNDAPMTTSTTMPTSAPASLYAKATTGRLVNHIALFGLHTSRRRARLRSCAAPVAAFTLSAPFYLSLVLSRRLSLNFCKTIGVEHGCLSKSTVCSS